MPVVLEKNIGSQQDSVTVLDLRESFFDPNWHFHPHYQLFTVLEGTGTRFIGDSIQYFEAGDTVFLGPNLPHLWRSDKMYFENNSTLKTHGIVLYFTEDFLGSDFFEKSEMSVLNALLKNSSRGLVWSGKTKQHVIDRLLELRNIKGFKRILILLDLLHSLSQSKDYQFITNENYTNLHKLSETERMQKVYEYVSKNFKDTIKLSDIAEKVNMSEAAFCRYFKKRTNRSFVDFVNEIRIGNACKLLSQNTLNVSGICFESGFNTISNFNFHFKKIVGKTPSEYARALKN
ncbi:AraC family transcriptional regulator [Lacihabitans sp. CS3-21]|uniref:AraC family transcriptional regulator n=1 Tax=Lacihabitans sp. CS3-21 TaxID=2487332 RepID=UPI0020CC6B64|nr:AraC family transcriptional regulator [Lacihabitans sp. CS3-21]MCP9745876.1 AraC family transcriptional regulator [Lacihabitans sp. CS3-21]